jgi:hypothetical protein
MSDAIGGARRQMPPLPQPPQPRAPQMPPLPQVPQAAPVRQPPPRPQALPANFVKWSAAMFLERGWKSRGTEHQQLKGELDKVAASLFDVNNSTSAASLTAEKLSPGREFKDYLTALSAFEKAPQDSKLAATTKSAAEAYIAHYNQHPERIRKQKDTKRKHDACQKTLADLKLLGQINDIGTPPWNSEMAMQAATVKAEADFASLPIGEQSAKGLHGKGVNPTFWVDKAGGKPGDTSHSFLFKPTTTKQDRTGVPSGGEPTREALTGRAGDILNGMIGIDCKVPQTDIIQVGRERFPDGSLSGSVVDKDGTGPLTGSLQQFSRTDGEMRENSPAKARAVPAERCQELAILDIVTLHVDRHSGNFLITGDDNEADLIPIDNGLSFPENSDDLGRMSTRHNAMLALPGAHEPFTPAMLKKVAKLDPDALKAALKTEVGVIENVHASAAGMVQDAALEQSRRSAMFLKRAAPTLSPALIQVAIGQYRKELLDPTLDDSGFRQAADRIIQAIASDKDILGEYFKSSPDEMDRINNALQAKGWDPFVLSPQQVMKLYKSGAQAPQAPNGQRSQQPGQQTLEQIKATDKEIADFTAAFPKLKPNAERILQWRELERLGGMSAVTAVVDKMCDTDSSAHNTTLGNLGRVITVLKVDQAAAAALKGAAVTDDRLLDGKRDVLHSLADLLPDPQKTAIKKNADTLRQKADTAGMDVLRDKINGVAMKLLAKEIDDFVAAAGRKDLSPQAQGTVEEIRLQKEAMYKDGYVLEVRRKVDLLKKQLG